MTPSIYVLESAEECASCGHAMKEGTIVVAWDGDYFCAIPCYRQARETWAEEPGIDHAAAQDQAFAALDEIRKTKPKHFVFLWSDGDDGDIGSTIFAHPGFVLACVPALLEGMMENEPNVAPPPD